MAGRTTLVFAHRLSSVIGADRILVLDAGAWSRAGTHAELIARRGAYARLMAAQAQDGAGATAPSTPRAGGRRGRRRDGDGPITASRTPEPADAILPRRAGSAGRAVLPHRCSGQPRLPRPPGAHVRARVARVAALIGVGALSALAVRAVKRGEPVGALLVALVVVAPLAGLLHWLESWLAHDIAYRLLADMRLDVFRKLDALAPAYLTRRRTGDLVGVATHDIELIEYFFAHTITPAFVAVLVPAAVLVTLGGLRLAAGARAAAVPALRRAQPGARARAHRSARARGRARPPATSTRTPSTPFRGSARSPRSGACGARGEEFAAQGAALSASCACRSCATWRSRRAAGDRPPGSAASRSPPRARGCAARAARPGERCRC